MYFPRSSVCDLFRSINFVLCFIARGSYFPPPPTLCFPSLLWVTLCCEHREDRPLPRTRGGPRPGVVPTRAGPGALEVKGNLCPSARTRVSVWGRGHVEAVGAGVPNSTEHTDAGGRPRVGQKGRKPALGAVGGGSVVTSSWQSRPPPGFVYAGLWLRTRSEVRGAGDPRGRHCPAGPSLPGAGCGGEAEPGGVRAPGCPLPVPPGVQPGALPGGVGWAARAGWGSGLGRRPPGDPEVAMSRQGTTAPLCHLGRGRGPAPPSAATLAGTPWNVPLPREC